MSETNLIDSLIMRAELSSQVYGHVSKDLRDEGYDESVFAKHDVDPVSYWNEWSVQTTILNILSLHEVDHKVTRLKDIGE